MLDELTDTVDRCYNYRIPTMVVHLSAGKAPRISDIGYERFSRLMEYADKSGVTIAYENQRMLANIAFALEEFPKAKFCWDTGHEACFTNGRRYMPLFGDRLAALHIHDNDKLGDRHQIPFSMNIDFDAVTKALKEIGYNGYLTLEADAYLKAYNEENVFEGIRNLAESAKKIRELML